MKTEPLNPYESPREASLPLPPSPRKLLIARLRGPSIGLLVLSGLQTLACFANFALLITVLIIRGVPVSNLNLQREIGMAALGFVPSLFIFVGAWQMRRMRSLHLCRAAAIMACIPCLSPVVVVGIPLGIWAAIVLFQKSTAEEFKQPTDQGQNLE